MIKLGHMLAQEQAKLKSELKAAQKQRTTRNTTSSTFYPNISKTSTLLQKSQVSPFINTDFISQNCSPINSPKLHTHPSDPDPSYRFNKQIHPSYRNKLETVQLPPNKPPLRRGNKITNLRNLNNNSIAQSNPLKGEESKENYYSRLTFYVQLCNNLIVQPAKSWLAFQMDSQKNSYESIIQMEKSAQALQQSAKEMSKALFISDDEGEFENLQNKFIDQIRFSKYRKPNQEKYYFQKKLRSKARDDDRLSSILEIKD